MLEINTLKNSSQNNLGVVRGGFWGFGGTKKCPDTLLAKTMMVDVCVLTLVQAPYVPLQLVEAYADEGGLRFLTQTPFPSHSNQARPRNKNKDSLAHKIGV